VADLVLTGGAALEKKLEAIARGLSRAARVKVGFLEGAIYPDGTSVPMVAAIQEFGAPAAGRKSHPVVIPPRPFFRNMIAAKSKEWPKAMAVIARDHNYNADTVLRLMGEAIAGQLRESIINTNDPPNAPSTIAGKGFDSPLIDTSHMLDSVDFEVE